MCFNKLSDCGLPILNQNSSQMKSTFRILFFAKWELQDKSNTGRWKPVDRNVPSENRRGIKGEITGYSAIDFAKV